MDKAPEYILPLDGPVCARRLVPWLKARGYIVLHTAVSVDGIHRIPALRTHRPLRGPVRPRPLRMRRPPAASALLSALPTLIAALADARGLDQVIAQAQAGMCAFPNVRSAHLHFDRGHRITPRQDPSPAPYAATLANRRRPPAILSAHSEARDCWITLRLADGSRTLGCLNLVAGPELLFGHGPELLRTAAHSISDALERERWRAHLKRLHDLHSRRTTELVAEIGARQRAEAELHRFTVALEQAGDSVFLIDTAGVIRYVNRAFEQLTGYARDEVVGHTPRLLRSGLQESGFYDRVWREIRSGRTSRNVFINRRRNGTIYYEQATISPLHDESGGISYFISTGRDITDYLATKERLRHLADHDALTGLAIRPRLAERIGEAIDAGHPFAVMTLDLDRFQRINDTFGPLAGDEVMQEFANRLRELASPRMTLARLGGDEFAGLLASVNTRAEAALFA